MTPIPRTASLLALAFLCPLLVAWERPYERGDFAPPADTREDRISNLEQRLSAEQWRADAPGQADGPSARDLGFLRVDPNERPKFTEAEAAWLRCKLDKKRECGERP